MNREMAMMKNKGSNLKLESEAISLMRRLQSEPFFDSFCFILVFRMNYA